MYATRGNDNPPMRRLGLHQTRDNKIYALLLTALALVSFVVILIRAHDIINEEQGPLADATVPPNNFYAPPKSNPVKNDVIPVIHINDDDDNDDDDDDDDNGDNERGKGQVESTSERLAAVKEAMKHAWRGYKKYAWGSDNLDPISLKGSNSNGLGATIIGSLDTLWIMGMKAEFNEARNWVASNFNPSTDTYVSFSETTSTILGGLLSAYALSGDSMFLDKAKDLGNRLIRAFDTNNALPYPLINLKTGVGSERSKNSSLTEVGAVQLELLYLSEAAGDPFYGEKALEVLDAVWEKNREFGGLVPTCLNLKNGEKCNGPVKFGNDGNSYYENLQNVYLFLGGKSSSKSRVYHNMFTEAVKSFVENLVKTSTPSGLKYIARIEGGKTVHRMKYASCAAGGMLTMAGATAFDSENYEYIKAGESVTSTCHEFYSRMASGMAPEAVKFTAGKDFKASVKYSLLRMEAAQSYFVNWRLTHNERYREWGWELLQALESKCRTEAGYAALSDVTKISPPKAGQMPEHFLAGTLKYLYLLYSEDGVVSLDDYVFSSEAHPFPVRKSGER